MSLETTVAQLETTQDASDEQLRMLLESERSGPILRERADAVRRRIYEDKVYIRGLIEFSNFCRRNCLYCGIRAGNERVHRYRLSEEDILACCNSGYDLGFRTFVLQGGEDPYFSDERMLPIVSAIRTRFPDCAITLSLGERSKDSYRALFDAGADRYLLRHETADPEHYGKLHPETMQLERRIQCLWDLKEIGFQVGTGMMVGSPHQTTANLIADLRFMQRLGPAMIGIGPFLRHPQTPLGSHPNGSFPLTLKLISIVRLLFPYALIPATTALGTIHPTGREEGLKHGANVVMPNLSPTEVRSLYTLYANKIATGEEAAEGRADLERRVKESGYRIVTDIGHPVIPH